jgi:hypothetical protein
VALVACVAFLAALAGCAAPLQNGGVEVRPGAEERLDVMCRYRRDAAGSGDARVCEAPAED